MLMVNYPAWAAWRWRRDLTIGRIPADGTGWLADAGYVSSKGSGKSDTA
jgi:hypothetical protein